MKKLFVSTAMAVMNLAMINAQEINFGAKAGINLATLRPELTESRTSFHLGGMAEITIADDFAIQPELLYSAQGAKDQNDSDNNETFKVDYLTLPVLAKYYLIEGLSVEGGPQIGFLLSSKQEDNGETDDLKDITKSIDIGFSLGAAYKLDNGLQIGARYYFGSDVNDIDEDPDEFKNNVFQFSIGYWFN